jgi:hypothetical protein
MPGLVHISNGVIGVDKGPVALGLDDTVQSFQKLGHDSIVEAIEAHSIVLAEGFSDWLLEDDVRVTHLLGAFTQLALHLLVSPVQLFHLVDENLVALSALHLIERLALGNLHGEGATFLTAPDNLLKERILTVDVLISHIVDSHPLHGQ